MKRLLYLLGFLFVVICAGVGVASAHPSNQKESPLLTPTPSGTTSATVISTPFPTCGTGADYVVSPQSSATIVPGTTDVGNHCNDCTTLITLPFSYSLYGQSFSTASVSDNGTVQFVSANAGGQNECLPYSYMSYTIFALWDDLRTDWTTPDPTGIYTSVSNEGGTLVFNIEWRAVYNLNSCCVPVHFEVRLYQGQDRFDIIYEHTDQGGIGTTIGVQRDSGTSYTQYLCTTSFRHNDQAIIGASPTNPNEMYAVWNDGRWDTTFVFNGVTGWHGDIAFTRSTDAGNTWATPVRINDDPQGNGRDQFFPWMTVGSDGTIHVSWMDRRDGAGFQYREYYTQSTDGGLTWSANQAVSDAGTTPSSFIGDYSGIAVNADNTIVMPVWTDQRGGQNAYIDRGIIGGITTPTVTVTPVLPTDTPTSTSTAVAATNTPTASPTLEPMCTPANFSDVHPTDYFYAAVQYLTCRGAISGYADNTFRPYNDTTRGQLTKIVVIAERFPIDTTGGPHFSDVPTTNPFYAFIETAYNRGLVSGYSDGTFRWGNNVTRGQLSKIIVQAEGWPIDTTGGPHFSDVPTTNPFYSFIETAYNHGIISGYSDGTFRPNNNATRGQISVIVYRALTAP